MAHLQSHPITPGSWVLNIARRVRFASGCERGFASIDSCSTPGHMCLCKRNAPLITRRPLVRILTCYLNARLSHYHSARPGCAAGLPSAILIAAVKPRTLCRTQSRSRTPSRRNLLKAYPIPWGCPTGSHPDAHADISQGNAPSTCQTTTLASIASCPNALATEMR